jgi:hypothetical protein
MGVREVQISEKIRGNLGDDGLREVCACLWPVDCQTCGRFLGDDAPSLVVNDMLLYATAALHHQACCSPDWNDSSLIEVTPGANVSFVTRAVMAPVGVGGRTEFWPMVLVNPGLEMVIMQRDEQRRWRVQPNAAFVAAGLVQVTAATGIIGAPAEGVIARLTRDSIAVTLQVPPFETYEAPAEEEIVDAARALGWVLFGVSHAVNPGELTVEAMNHALTAGRVMAGRVAFHGPRPADTGPQRRPSVAAVTYVLHWNDRQMTVGMLVAHTARMMTSRKAQRWAGQLIGTDDALTGWRPADKGDEREGWFNLSALSAGQYFLRHYTDGWKLIKAYSHVGGRSGVESDNEAKAWAASVLKLRAGIYGLAWEPGPATPGSHTLYART